MIAIQIGGSPDAIRELIDQDLRGREGSLAVAHSHGESATRISSGASILRRIGDEGSLSAVNQVGYVIAVHICREEIALAHPSA